jgi:hypothetical protein
MLPAFQRAPQPTEEDADEKRGDDANWRCGYSAGNESEFGG